MLGLHPVDDREPREVFEQQDMMKFSPPITVNMDYEGGTPRQVRKEEKERGAE